MIGLKNGLFTFQEDCVTYLLDETNIKQNNTIVVKAPTGAGKTLILIDYIDKYLSLIDDNTVFIWLCPGKGDLEEQSRKKMTKHLPSRNSKVLSDVIASGFEPEDVAFINWELVTKKGNKAITENERKNLFEHIINAHKKGINFILIIDEEHSNDTTRARDIINSFNAKNIIRVSATAKKNPTYEFYGIPESKVISSGLITKALYINEDVENNIGISNEHEYLIDLAEKKRIEISEDYNKLSIRPLVIIQFPSMSDSLIEEVEDILNKIGYSYDNKMLAKWMSDEKINIDDIELNNAEPIYLLMKQAISTGWDCPRAKILIKLRENMDEDFEIQTLGRLRRMPEAVHYDNELLDNCYLYTFDEKYKQSIKSGMGNAFEVKRVFLKDKCKVFQLEKQLKNKDFDGFGERETFEIIHNYFVEKFNFTDDEKQNCSILEANNYDLSKSLKTRALQGKFVQTESLLDNKSTDYVVTYREVNTHKNGIDLMHSIDAIKSTVGMKYNSVKAILERLFKKCRTTNGKMLNLDVKEYYAFIINNEELLKGVFKEATSQKAIQIPKDRAYKTSTFRIPLEEIIKYDSSTKRVVEMISNAYKEYPSSVLVDGIRSKSERMLERYLESNDKVDWIYKNGDSGQQYFSVVYIDAVGKQWLFYPDYIVKMKNEDIWILETKGGENADSTSKNIDKQSTNKFDAFKNYAEEKNLKWGFVRDTKDEELCLNNTEFIDDLNDDRWVLLSTIL